MFSDEVLASLRIDFSIHLQHILGLELKHFKSVFRKLLHGFYNGMLFEQTMQLKQMLLLELVLLDVLPFKGLLRGFQKADVDKLLI